MAIYNNKAEFRTRKITRHKERHYIMIKVLTKIHCYPKWSGTEQRVSKCIKQKLKELGEKNRQIQIILQDFNISLSVINRIIIQKISKDTEELNFTNQSDLINIYRTIYPTAAEYTVFSSAIRSFTMKAIFWATKHTSLNLKELKLFRVL